MTLRYICLSIYFSCSKNKVIIEKEISNFNFQKVTSTDF